MTNEILSEGSLIYEHLVPIEINERYFKHYNHKNEKKIHI